MTDTDAPVGPNEDDALGDEPLDQDLTEMLDALREDSERSSDGFAAGVFEAPAGAPESRPAVDLGVSEVTGARPETGEPVPALGLDESLFGFAADELSAAEATSVLGQTEPPFAAPVDESPWADLSGDVVPATAPGETAVIPIVADVPRELDLGPTKRSRWWVWVLVILALLLVVGAGGYAWWWSTSRGVIAPDVVGKKPAEATQTLNDVGLRLGNVSEIPTDSAPAGTIISQKPEAGSRLKPEDALSFVVAAAPEQAKVPNVVGVSTEQASANLAEARLRPYEVASHNATVAAGFVVAQLPAPGTEIMPGAAIAVVVSRGPAPNSTTVPHIKGMIENDAVTLLKAVGLQPRVYRSPDASLTVGTVGTQTPLPGTAAVPGSVVQFIVSQGGLSGTVSVPDVTAKSRKSAVAALKEKGLNAQVVVVANATVARGMVISQMPLAGGRSTTNGIVGVLVSRGNVTQGPVPSLTGTSSAEATRVITAAGFRPVMITIGTDSYTAGTVFAQFPSSGFIYGFRLPVVCLVAKSAGQ